MRFGLSVANFGSYAEPARFAELAATAEGAGWEGVFVWDHLAFAWGEPAGDPWLLLAAASAATERALLGTYVTPLAVRRRPHELALALATLDRLSGGRVVFGAGLGGNERELAAFGDERDDHVRAELLDEGLDLLRALLSGARVDHRGTHFTADGVTLLPPPLQQPLPIWIGGNAPRPLRRAARFHGWAANSAGRERMTLSPDEVADRVATIGRGDDFDVVVQGYSDQVDPAAYEQAGATWWLECLHDARAPYDAVLALVARGPGA